MITYSEPSFDRELKSDDSIQSFEYNFPTPELNIAEICIRKRYPESGFAKNNKSKMIVKVLSGEVVLSWIESECVREIRAVKNSVVYIEAGTLYYWNPEPEVTLYIVSNPPWNKDQAENILDKSIV